MLMDVTFLLVIGLAIVRSTNAAACSNSYFGENKPKDKDNELESNTDNVSKVGRYSILLRVHMEISQGMLPQYEIEARNITINDNKRDSCYEERHIQKTVPIHTDLLENSNPFSIGHLSRLNGTYVRETELQGIAWSTRDKYFGYLMGESDYIIDCCGIVDGWEAFFDGVSGSRTIYFQIWRQTTGTSYELVGQNPMSVSSDGEQSLSVAASDRITIKNGDRWGWWSSGTDIITYKKGGGEEDDNYFMSLSSLSEGDVQNWGSATLQNDRSYAMRVNTLPNDTPTFTNLPSTVSIVSSTSSGTSLITVGVDDVNTDDVSTLDVSMTTSTSMYSFDDSTYIVSTASALSSSSTVDRLTFKVVDQCDNTATATLTVSITNEPPEIHSLPASNSVSEDETAETLLHTLSATDPESSPTCSLASSVPSTYPFTVKMIPSSTSYGIYSDSSPGFDYNTKNEYALTIECTDGEFTVDGVFTAYIVKNVSPTFINLQNSTSVTTSSLIGSNAFTVLVSDPENDDLSFTMTCNPTPCPFNIFASGAIQISEDLSDHTTVGYDLFITVSDGRNTVGPSTLTITIADINDPVSLNNLPVTKVVPENTAVGTLVYDVNYSDLDTSQTHSFSMTSSPNAGLTYFTIDSSSGIVSVSTSPDYDVLTDTTYVLTITVSDPITSDTNIMTVEITNVNESPSFSQAGYTLSTTEGSADDVIGTPSFGVTDPDVGDSYTLILDCGTETGYFSMTSPSGEVSFQSNYDLDVGSLPTTVSCTVTATDVGGLSDTATLTISIDYINDNTPIFSPSAYTFHVNYFAVVGSRVGTITATDADAGSYGVLTFTLDQTSLSDEYFSIDNSGEITIKTSLIGSPLGYATTVTISSTASDVEGSSDTATIVIAISDTTTTSTTTTTIRYKTFLEDSRNITWVTLCVVLLLASMVLLLYIIFTCHGENGCSAFRRSCRGTKIRKPKKWNPKRRGSYSFGEQPNSAAKPTVRNPPPPAGKQAWRATQI